MFTVSIPQLEMTSIILPYDGQISKEKSETCPPQIQNFAKATSEW